MTLSRLDAQLHDARRASEIPDLPEHTWSILATTIHAEIRGLDEMTINRLRNTMAIPPERYYEELVAFQAWMDIAHTMAAEPVIVRAQVMTELYVAFVWLRDPLLQPLADALQNPQAALSTVHQFLSNGHRRRLRNAVAHGRWCYRPHFDGLECWDGRPPQHFTVSDGDLQAWQLLSRGTAIAAILAVTDGYPLTGSPA